jgi:N-acetylmuramoyl-L-alanine amidase
MRNIQYIVIHCTATQPSATIAAIQNYWKTTLGWKNPGYHYILPTDGSILQLLDESLIANGVAGYNHACIHLSYIGGVSTHNIPLDTRNLNQLSAMYYLVKLLKAKYPSAIIQGHRDFPGVKKACPSFDVREWLKELLL